MNQHKNQDRTRNIPIVRSFLFIIAITALWYFCSRYDFGQPKSQATAVSQPAQSRQAAIYPAGKFLTYTVRTGDTFQGILSGFGVSYTNAINFYRMLKSVGLPAIFPGDSLVLALDHGDRLKSFSLLNQLKCWYHLQKDSIALTVEKQPLRTMRYRCIVKGTLNTSLSEDMFKLGVGDAVVGKLADIFAWDINFFMDPRKGDTFEVLFEKIYREGSFVGYGEILAAKYVNKGEAKYAIAFAGTEGRLSYYNAEGKSVQKQFLKAPLRFRRISSGFSYRRRHPILGIARPHLGIDYAAPRGTPVYAAADGTIRFIGKKGGYGNFIRIAHGGAYETTYGHLHRYARGMRAGIRVAQGQFIGTVGSTGLSTGPHLDYRMKRHGRFINPLTVRLPSKHGVEQKDRHRFEAVKYEYLSLLKSRFVEEGYYVLDIEKVPTADSAVTHISIIANLSDES